MATIIMVIYSVIAVLMTIWTVLMILRSKKVYRRMIQTADCIALLDARDTQINPNAFLPTERLALFFDQPSPKEIIFAAPWKRVKDFYPIIDWGNAKVLAPAKYKTVSKYSLF